MPHTTNRRGVAAQRTVALCHSSLVACCQHHHRHDTHTTERATSMPSVSFLPFLQTVPWGTRSLTALVILSSLSYFAAARYVAKEAAAPPSLSDILPWVVLTPAVSWKYPWTLLTAGFVEITWIEVWPRLSGLTLTATAHHFTRDGAPRMPVSGASLGFT